MTQQNYWAFRISKAHANFLYKELTLNRLRQGWGYDPRQDLRCLTLDNGARKNIPMLKVQKGDILLIPHIKNYNLITLAKALDNWDTAYQFAIDPKLQDFGHIFPAQEIMTIAKQHKEVSSDLRRTLNGTRMRFWSLNDYKNDIDYLLNLPPETVNTFIPRAGFTTLTENLFEEFFDSKTFQKKLYELCTKSVQNAEWENFLVPALRALFPAYQVDKVGGQSEQEHGTDIKITIPGLLGDSYIIAIQVKDFTGEIPPIQEIIKQINKADAFNNETTKVIEKIVLVTRANKEQNKIVPENMAGVKFIFAEEFKELLLQASSAILGLTPK